MRTYGLIGYPLSHSFSERYFSDKFAKEQIAHLYNYQLFPLSNLTELFDLLATHPNLNGLNVTIPYKQRILPLLNDIDEEAQKVGAVNCIAIAPDRSMKGYNTDIYGFERSLLSLFNPNKTSLQALLLGTGGAAKAVRYVLQKNKIAYTSASRNPEDNIDNSNLNPSSVIGYTDIDATIIAQHLLIINTTPLGMYPDIHSSPTLPYQALTPQHLCYDLVYNPIETQFLQKARLQGARTQNGLDMLYFQAEAAWEIWKKAQKNAKT